MMPLSLSPHEAPAHGRRCARRAGVDLGSAIRTRLLQGIILLFALAFIGRQAAPRLTELGVATHRSASTVTPASAHRLHDHGERILLEAEGDTVDVEEDDEQPTGPSLVPSLTDEGSRGPLSLTTELPAPMLGAPLRDQARHRPGLPRGPPPA